MPRGNSSTKYRIRINGWDKWQSPTKSKRRHWVAMSTDIMHDPDFFNLTLEQRYLWMMLLLHAGKKGPVFELDMSSARVVFKLRPGWRGVADFDQLEKQGFIDFHVATGQDITGHNNKDPLTPTGVGELARPKGGKNSPPSRKPTPRELGTNPRAVRWGDLTPEQIQAAKDGGCKNAAEYLAKKAASDFRYEAMRRMR